MMRALQIFNFIGVLALAGLCVVQWGANRRANHEVIALETKRGEQAAKMDEQQRVLDGTKADLEDFRERLAAAESAAKEARTGSAGAEAQVKQLTTQRDELAAANEALKASLGQWSAAVAARDEALKKAEAELQAAAKDRNGAIGKFNDVAVKYNAAVEEIKKANAAIGKLAQERDEAVAKYNELAGKYNALAAPTTGKAGP